jgi:hypothetical protein
LVIIIAGFAILASVLTAVEPCRSSCQFGHAAGRRLLQSSANSQLLYPGGRSRKPKFFWEASTPCERIEWKPSGLEKMARWVSRYQREQWLLVTGTEVTLHRALFPLFLHLSSRRPAALPPGVGQGSKKQRGKNRKRDRLANCGGWVGSLPYLAPTLTGRARLGVTIRLVGDVSSIAHGPPGWYYSSQRPLRVKGGLSGADYDCTAA